jgi:hypothetical protein
MSAGRHRRSRRINGMSLRQAKAPEFTAETGFHSRLPVRRCDGERAEEDGFEPSVPLRREVLERSNISTAGVLFRGD